MLNHVEKSDLMTNSDSNRLRFIEILQTIGIILVVVGHSFHEYPDGVNGNSFVVRNMIYSFHIPLFIFASGFLLILGRNRRIASGRRRSLARFSRNRARQLLIPFVTLTIVTFVPRAMMSGLADDNIPLSAESLLSALVHPDNLVIPYFWFLQALFILSVTVYAIVEIADRAGLPHRVLYPLLVIVAVIIPVLPPDYPAVFSLNTAIGLAVYFTAGGFYARYRATIDRHVNWTSPAMPVISGALWVALFYLSTGYWTDILCAFAGILMCVSLSKIIEARDYRFLDHLAGANYLIFLLSWYLNVAAQQVLHHFTDFPWWVYSIMSVGAGIYVPWLAYGYLTRHPDSRWVSATAWLLGQRTKRRPNVS